ncbi:pentatricopeptide repeat-containing protein [Tanacetum coccineum]
MLVVPVMIVIPFEEGDAEKKDSSSYGVARSSPKADRRVLNKSPISLCLSILRQSSCLSGSASDGLAKGCTFLACFLRSAYVPEKSHVSLAQLLDFVFMNERAASTTTVPLTSPRQRGHDSFDFAMIGGYTHRHSYKESLDLFRTMMESDYKPNEVTLLSVIPACAHMGALDSGKWIHAYTNKNFRDSSNTSLYTSLIDMYAKCGDIEAAKTVFKNVKTKNLASWNAMISGLAMHRRADEAIGLFKNMVNEGLTPDDITFVGVLSACSHGGLVNLGKKYFNLMIQEYKISPKLQHYGCVIDLLARADLFVEAMDIIKKMEVKPDSAIWGSLLGSCISYKNVQLGEYFAKKVLELDLKAHTLQMVKWDDIGTKCGDEENPRIRTKFRDEGSKKIPGCTSIEVNGIVHEFLASDKTHPMSDKIYAMLEETNRLLDNYGHVPDTSLVLYDMDDELKECVVSQHSERLAIAFGLIRKSLLGIGIDSITLKMVYVLAMINGDIELA